MITTLLQALAVTVIVEVPIYALILVCLANVPAFNAVVAAALINVVSYPLFTWILVPSASRFVSPLTAVVIAEVIVCALEAGMLGVWLRRDALVIIAGALIANGCSIVAGLIYFELISR